MTLMLVILRRVNNEESLTSVFMARFQNDLIATLFMVPKQGEYDEEAAKYFLLIEEILLSLSPIGYYQQPLALQFVEQFISQVLGQFVNEENENLENPNVVRYVLGTLRLLILMQKTQGPCLEKLVLA